MKWLPEADVTGRKRKVVVKVEPSSSSQGTKSKGGVTTRSALQSAGAEHSSGGLSMVPVNLNSKVFPQYQTLLPEGEVSEVIQVLQGGLLQVSFSINLFYYSRNKF